MITRRKFNQGAIAAAAVAAIPLFPTPPQVEPYLEQVPTDRILGLTPRYPMEFQVRLMEHRGRTTMWEVENLTDLILRIRGYDARHYEVTRHVFELEPHGTYGFFASTITAPRFELLAQYRWVS